MARQTGILKIKGTIGGMTFYRSQDGHLVKEKSGVDGSRIANDPTFARTRENGAEFGQSAIMGKLVRDTLRNLMQNASDSRVTSRLTAIMTQIKDYDSVSARGERTVAIGISDPQAKELLNGFNFNDKAIMGSILFAPYIFDPLSGNMTFNNMIPINDLNYPIGATHFTLTNAWAAVNFATGQKDMKDSGPRNFAIDGGPLSISFNPPGPPSVPGTQIYLLKIEFFQEINGIQYSLKNGAYNALTIVDLV